MADYKAWCGRTKLGEGDCLEILNKGRMTSQGRYVWGLAMARSKVFEAALESARQAGQPEAVLGMLACATGMYLFLWAIPEPASKFIAAGITIGLIIYLGVRTVDREARKT